MLIDDEETLEAKWVVNSETSEQHLVDVKTGTILATKDKNGSWIYK